MRFRLTSIPIVLSLLLATGCGGSGSDQPAQIAREGFYRGSITYRGTIDPTTRTVPAVAEYQQDGSILAIGSSEDGDARLFRDKDTDALILRKEVLTGTISEELDGSNLNLTFSLEQTEYASATLRKSQEPSLGSQVSIPAAANYSGEVIIYENGHLSDLGHASGSVSGTGVLSLHAEGGGYWNAGDGTITGTFEPDGTLSEAKVLIGGTEYVSDLFPRYSNDGETLKIRLENLARSATAWLTLRSE